MAEQSAPSELFREFLIDNPEIVKDLYGNYLKNNNVEIQKISTDDDDDYEVCNHHHDHSHTHEPAVEQLYPNMQDLKNMLSQSIESAYTHDPSLEALNRSLIPIPPNSLFGFECRDPNCTGHESGPCKRPSLRPVVEFIVPSVHALNMIFQFGPAPLPVIPPTPEIKACRENYTPGYTVSLSLDGLDKATSSLTPKQAKALVYGNYNPSLVEYIYSRGLIKAAAVCPASTLAPLIFPTFDTCQTKWQPSIVFSDTRSPTLPFAGALQEPFKRSVKVVDRQGMPRFTKPIRYLESPVARDLMRKSYRFIAPNAYRKDAEAQAEDKQTCHPFKIALKNSPALENQLPPHLSVRKWRRHIFESPEITAKVHMSGLYFDIDSLLLCDDVMEPLVHRQAMTNVFFGPYFFHRRLRQIIFEDLMADKGKTPGGMRSVIMIRTRDRLENSPHNPWTMVPVTWEDAPHISTVIRRAFAGIYGTTMFVDTDIAEWPENLCQVTNFNKAWPIFKKTWEATVNREVMAVDYMVDNLNPKYVSVAERRQSAAKKEPWKPSSEQILLMSHMGQEIRRMLIGSWITKDCDEAHAIEDPKSLLAYDQHFIDNADPNTPPADRLYSPEFIQNMLEMVSPYTVLEAIRNRFNARAEDVAPLVAPKIARILATMDLSPLYSKSEDKVWEFVGRTWDSCLKPLYVVFFSCHTSRISAPAFVALWLYSVITTGYGIEESEKGSKVASPASAGGPVSAGAAANSSNSHSGFHSKKKKNKKKTKKTPEPATANPAPQGAPAEEQSSMRAKLYRKMFTQAELAAKYPALARVFTALYDLSVEPTAFQLKLQLRGNTSYQNLVCKDWNEETFGRGWDACVQPAYQAANQPMDDWAGGCTDRDGTGPGERGVDESQDLGCACQLKADMKTYIAERREALGRGAECGVNPGI